MSSRFLETFTKHEGLVCDGDGAIRIWNDVADQLRDRLPGGSQSDTNAINDTLHLAYDIVHNRLCRLLKQLASREVLEFTLHQYEIFTAAYRATPRSHDASTIRENARLVQRRRALKYLAEQIALSGGPEYSPLSRKRLIRDTHDAIVCCDILVVLYSYSDTVHCLFPNCSTLTIMPPGTMPPFSVAFGDPHRDAFARFELRLSLHFANASHYFDNASFDHDAVAQGTSLNAAFEAEFGVSYQQCLRVLERTRCAPPFGDSYPIAFYNAKALAAALGVDEKLPEATVSLILRGFTLRRVDMQNEGRQLYSTRQAFRAFRRGFLEIKLPSGPNIAWSQVMAEECLIRLASGTCYRKLPHEWRGPNTTNALDALSRRAGDWFAKHATRKLHDRGFLGSARKRVVGARGVRLEIPDGVGEIDFLGSLPGEGIIVVMEFKMVEDLVEPFLMRDDVSEFARQPKSYANKFRMKLRWVLENQAALSTMLCGSPDARPVAAVMVTMYPTIASEFIPDFACVSLVEFLVAFDAAGTWPNALCGDLRT